MGKEKSSKSGKRLKVPKVSKESEKKLHLRSPPEVRAYYSTLEKVLNDERACASFLKHSSRAFPNNPAFQHASFYRAVVGFKQAKTYNLAAAHLIYQKFLLPDSVCYLAKPPEMIEEIRSCLLYDEEGLDPEGRVTSSLFDRALISTTSFLADLFISFLSSPEYHKFIEHTVGFLGKAKSRREDRERRKSAIRKSRSEDDASQEDSSGRSQSESTSELSGHVSTSGSDLASDTPRRLDAPYALADDQADRALSVGEGPPKSAWKTFRSLLPQAPPGLEKMVSAAFPAEALLRWPAFLDALQSAGGYTIQKPGALRKLFLIDNSNLVYKTHFKFVMTWFAPIKSVNQASTGLVDLIGMTWPDVEALVSLPYFFGFYSGEQTTGLLAGKPAGTYLFRFSQSEPGSYTASVSLGPGERVQNWRIQYFLGNFQMGGLEFGSLPNLVRFYEKHNLPGMQQALCLYRPISQLPMQSPGPLRSTHSTESTPPNSPLSRSPQSYLSIPNNSATRDRRSQHANKFALVDDEDDEPLPAAVAEEDEVTEGFLLEDSPAPRRRK